MSGVDTAKAMALLMRLVETEVLTQEHHVDGLCVFCHAQREPYGRAPFPHRELCLWQQALEFVAATMAARMSGA